jgi:hypothetical protein
MKGFRQRVVSRPVPHYFVLLRKRGADLTTSEFANYHSTNSFREPRNLASPRQRKRTREPPIRAPRRLRKAHLPSLPPIQLTERPPRRRRSSLIRGTNHYPATITSPMPLTQASYNPASQVSQARLVLDLNSHSSSQVNRELVLLRALAIH